MEPLYSHVSESPNVGSLPPYILGEQSEPLLIEIEAVVPQGVSCNTTCSIPYRANNLEQPPHSTWECIESRLPSTSPAEWPLTSDRSLTRFSGGRGKAAIDGGMCPKQPVTLNRSLARRTLEDDSAQRCGCEPAARHVVSIFAVTHVPAAAVFLLHVQPGSWNAISCSLARWGFQSIDRVAGAASPAA